MAVTDNSQGVGLRLVGRLRWVSVRGLASVIAGVLVLGIGGRLVMLASRLIHPDAVGRLTDNGNRIGEFTVEGTIGLIIFGGLLSGAIAGVIWAVVREWLSDRVIVVGLGAVAIGGLNLVSSENRDFVILREPAPDIALLLALIFVFGVTLVWIDRWLDRRLPAARTVTSIVTYSLIVSFGASLMIPLVGSFFSKSFCFCADPPIWIGVFFVIAALVTVSWWVIELRGAETPPEGMKRLGALSVGLTAIAGTVLLADSIITIL